MLREQGEDVVHFNRGEAASQLAETPPTIHGDRKDFSAFDALMAEAGSFDCVIDMVCFQPEKAVRAFRGRTEQFI